MTEITEEMVVRVADAYGHFIARDNGWDADGMGYDGWMKSTEEWRLGMAREMLAAAHGTVTA